MEQQYTGLSTKQAQALQEQYGRNDVEEQVDTALVRLLKKFYGPIPLMIEVALVLSLIIGKYEDFAIITVLLLINVSVDFLQEQKARVALEAIKHSLAHNTAVLRDGTWSDIDARDLVPKDVVELPAGSVVPADAMLIDDDTLIVDQSAITGESLPVEIHKGDKLHAGSLVQKGSAVARITAIGEHSAIGKSMHLVAKAEREEESEFQKAILKISRFLVALSASLAIIVFVLLLMRGDTLMETLRFVLVLAIASIPIALPAVLSVTMAIGANALSKKNTIVSNFKAIEELAGVDTLCTDKTGTLTKNEMAPGELLLYGNNCEHDKLITYALLASDTGYKTPIEHGIYTYAKAHDILPKLHDYTVHSFTAFDPRTKVTAADITNNTSQERFTVTMGATQVIAQDIKDEEQRNFLSRAVANASEHGFKTVAISITNDGVTLLAGVIPLLDPPRDDAKKAVEKIRNKGIAIKMVTGDNAVIADHIARLLDIGNRVVQSSTLRSIFKSKSKRDDVDAVNGTDVFAEVTPEDKYHIVETLQSQGSLVAMTGDGVNDAPALKKANIGIAVSGATDAAQSAADIVLVTPGLSVIHHAVRQARIIFARMQSYATFRISETIRIILFISLAVLFWNNIPLTAVMIILLALLNDLPVMTIAYDNANPESKPVRWRMRETLTIATVLGALGLVSSFALLFALHSLALPLAVIQTIMFLKLDVSGHSTLYLTRSNRNHFWQRPYPAPALFGAAFGTRIIGTLLALFGIFMEPISLATVCFVWVYATAWLFVNDQVKVWVYRWFDKQAKAL